MTPTEERRLSTWSPEIVSALLGGAQPRREGADVLRFEGHGGLTINTRTGFWRLWGAVRSHWSALPLIETLGNLTRAEAREWGAAWLASHEGTGSCGSGEDIEDETDIERAEYARELMGRMAPLAVTPGEPYLRDRGIWRDGLPSSLGYIADVRVGEGAFAAMLAFRGRVVGLQITHLDPDGRKSTIPPVRRRYMMERAAGAAFHLARPLGIYATTNIIVAEGVEDAMSVASLGRPAEVIGVPGVGIIQHLEVPKGATVTVVRDGDPEGSAPDHSLVKGLDHLLLAGAVVAVTETPPGEDANSILMQSGGPEALGALIDAAVPATLSPEGEIERLSRLSDLDYEQVRKAEADRLGIRVSILDRSVQVKRSRASPAADDTEDDGLPGRPITYLEIVPWPEPVEGAALLAAISEAIREYVRIEEHEATALALYVIFSHCFDIFEYCQKIILKSAQKRSGKTRTLQVMKRLVNRSIHITGAEPAALLRIIARDRPTLLFDELDTMMRSAGTEMAAALTNILNAGFDDNDGRPKNVQLPGGGWDPRLFDTKCPQVLAGIGSLPDTVADRAVVITMERKKPGDTVKRLRARDGDDLRELARKAARWAGDHSVALGAAKPEPPPGLNDRAADAWEPLFAIADLAGGGWPILARAAATKLVGAEDTETTETELLADIRDAFGIKDRVRSETLVAYLLGREDRPWAEINHGRPLTKHGLARRLRPFGVRPGKLKLSGGATGPTAQGYRRADFANAFERYLAQIPPSGTDQTGTPEPPQDFQGLTADSEVAPPTSGSGLESVGNPSVSAEVPEVPDQTPGAGGTDEDTPEPRPLSNGEAHPAEADTVTGAPRLSAIDEHILAYAEAHPGTSIEQIAKGVGQPKAVVATVLGSGA